MTMTRKTLQKTLYFMLSKCSLSNVVHFPFLWCLQVDSLRGHILYCIWANNFMNYVKLYTFFWMLFDTKTNKTFVMLKDNQLFLGHPG